MAERLTRLLNTCRDGNLPASDQAELSALIGDFFTCDPQHDDFSDDDFDAETDTEIADENADESDGEDSPLVNTEEIREDTDSRIPVDEAPFDGGLLKVCRERSCKANGSGCKQIKVSGPSPSDPRKGCITQFSPEEIVALRMSLQAMDRDSKEWFILGILSSCMRTGQKTECSKWKEQRDRTRARSSYCLLTNPVCKDAFLFCLGISQDLLTRLHKHYQAEGLTLPTRRAGGRKNNTRSLALDDTARVVRFIKNYAEDHAVCLPGRVPGYKREDIRLLPSASPKSHVYQSYAEFSTARQHRQVSKAVFGKLWKELCPYIVVARPMTDLCWKCQQNNSRIYRSANLPLEEKDALLLAQQAHLRQVEEERTLYREMAAEAKVVAQLAGVQRLQASPPNSGNFEMHYSFDFAQQVHYPNDAAQPGPLYFLTPRKCGIFGVHCEGLSQQVNFLIDESVSGSKGSKAVISYMHYFFENYGLGEKSVNLHCDNCSGQNKNRWVLFYLAWRVQRGLHDSVTVNFMPPGHTKFAPDWCFGLLKRCYRRAHVSCLEDMEEVVRRSTPQSHLNIPQLVGREDASVIVPTYGWHTFFGANFGFKPLPGIKPLGHFRFDSRQPGVVFYKQMIADAEQQFVLATPAMMAQLPRAPNVIPAPGLSDARRRYLFQHIREYVRVDRRNLVCPDPAN